MHWFCVLLLLMCGTALGKKLPPPTKTIVKEKKSEEKKAPLAPTESDFNNVPFPETPATHVLLMEETHGLVLMERQANVAMPPSSMIKILAAYTVLDLLKSSNLKLETLITISKEAYKKEGSSMFLEINSQVSIQELLQGLIIVSGNDAAVALAESLSGTEKVFAERMTRKAIEIGAHHTKCANSSGLPDTYTETTCHDLVVIARAFMKKFPEHYLFFAVPSFTHNNITQPNRNPFTGWGVYPCDGIKTGFTDAGGYGAVGSCLSSDPSNNTSWRLMVVMNGLSSKNERATEAKKLADWAFQNFGCVTYPVRLNVPVRLGDQSQTLIGADVQIVLPKGQKASVTIKYPSYLKGGHPEKTCVGEIKITSPAWKKSLTIPLVVLKEVKNAHWLSGLWDRMTFMFAAAPQTITQTKETPAA